MPDRKISELDPAAALADNDLLVVVDVSNTAMAASGTTERVPVSVARTSILAPHLAAVDPHPVYLSAAEGATADTAAIAGHVAAADPHADRAFATAAIATAVANLIATAPGALDTLNELAAALANDPNFAATMTTALAGKQPLDADLTAIALLTTTTYGRALLALADGTNLAADAAFTGKYVSGPAANAAATYGADVVTNGTFTGDATGWTLTNGAVYNANNLTIVDTATVAQTVNVVAGTLYQISAVRTTGTGYYTIALGAASGNSNIANTPVTIALMASVTGPVTLQFTSVGATGTLDTITCQPVTPSTVGATIAGIAVRASGSGLAAGANAQQYLTTGTNNLAFGNSAQQFLTSGGSNLALGNNAQKALTTGGSNFAVGFNAQQALTAGTSNVALGPSAQFNLLNGTGNSGIGSAAQSLLTTGSANTGIGSTVQSKLTTGNDNTGIGYLAGTTETVANASTTASRQTVVGREAGQGSAVQSDDIVALGYRAKSDGAGAVALGSGALAPFAGSVALGMSTVASAANQIAIGTRHVEAFKVAAAPAAGAANSARLYVLDNGAGKGKLMIQFATGAAQQIAIEP